MKRQTARWIRKAQDDLSGAKVLAAGPEPQKDLVCFHCQQAAEKYLKALLQDFGVIVPKTHDLGDLLKLLLPHDATLKSLRRSVESLTRFAVEYRYPDKRANTREMQSALRVAERVRSELEARLGLPP